LARFLSNVPAPDQLWLIQPFDFKRNCIKVACLIAFQAADAFAMVGVFVKFNSHGADVLTGSAMGTCLLIPVHPKDTHGIEQGIDGTQGAHGPTERAAGKGHPDKQQNQNGYFAEKQGSDESPQVRAQKHERDSGLQGSGRTDMLAEPGTSKTEVIHDEKGQQKYKYDQNDIFDVCEGVPDAEFACGEFMHQILEKAKGTQPSAGHPAQQGAYHA
jgi:hypothetical protein